MEVSNLNGEKKKDLWPGSGFEFVLQFRMLEPQGKGIKSPVYIKTRTFGMT